MLRDIKSMNQNIFLTVDTTCPLPRGGNRPATPKGQTRTFEPPPTIPEDNSHEALVQHEDEKSHKKHKRSSRERHHHHHRKRSKERRKYDQSDIPDWIKAEMEVASKEMQQPKVSWQVFRTLVYYILLLVRHCYC